MNTTEQYKKPPKKTRFYRDKSVMCSLLVGFCVLFVTTHLFLAFLTYVVSRLFLDWLFFTHDGYKESEQAPESFFLEQGITPDQLDQYNTFMIKIRRIAFAASISISAACLMYFQSFDYNVVFVISYIGINFGALIVALRKRKIVWPYHTTNIIKDDQGIFSSMPIDRSYFNSTSDSPVDNPFWLNNVKPRNYLK